MLDINGQLLWKGDFGSLLCEILEVSQEGVRIRIANSDEELLVGCRHDEAFGDMVADSELTAFDPAPREIPRRPVSSQLE